MVNKRKYPFEKRYRPSRSDVTPSRRVRRAPMQDRRWMALNVMNNHFRVHKNRENINELNELADDAEFRYGTGPLSNGVFNMKDPFLIQLKEQSTQENFQFTGGNWHGGYPFNPTPDQKWVLDYNKTLIHDFNKHLKARQQHRDFKRFENDVLYKFK